MHLSGWLPNPQTTEDGEVKRPKVLPLPQLPYPDTRNP